MIVIGLLFMAWGWMKPRYPLALQMEPHPVL